MKNRREFVKGTIGFFLSAQFFWSPFSSVLKTALAKGRKVILPKGTKRKSLIDMDPAELDPRNLEITPLEDFGIMGLRDHKTDLNSWRLEISGRLDHDMSLSYSQILSLPSVERKVLLICPGIFANYGRWKGISVKELLQLSGVQKGATQVTFRGPKSRYESVQSYPLDHVLSDQVFLAYEVNGKPLPRKNGFPLRVVAEGYYGYDWVKYVYKLTVE